MNNFGLNDTFDIKKKISIWEREIKKNIKQRIYQYTTPDSPIFFGSNKQKSLLTLVLIYNRKRHENRWYYYNKDGIFRISIQETKIKHIRPRNKFFTYYFENGNLIYYTSENSKYKPSELLLIANSYTKLAIPYLQSQ